MLVSGYSLVRMGGQGGQAVREYLYFSTIEVFISCAHFGQIQINASIAPNGPIPIRSLLMVFRNNSATKAQRHKEGI